MQRSISASRPRSRIVVAVFIIALAGLTACSSSGGDGGGGVTTKPSGKGALKEVKIGMPSPSLAYGPVQLAIAKGYFQQEGLQPKAVTVDSGPPTVSALVRGDVDLSAMVMQEMANADAQGVDPKLTAFAQLLGQTPSGLAVRKDFLAGKGVTESSTFQQKIAALKGARFGITAIGGGGDSRTRQVLKDGGLNPDKDVTITALGTTDGVVSAFIAHRIDAFLLSPPSPETVVADGSGTILLNLSKGEWPEGAGQSYNSLVATAPYIQKHADVIRAATRAIQKALKYAAASPAGAKAALKSAYFKDMGAKVFDIAATDTFEAVDPGGVVFNVDGVTKLLKLYLPDSKITASDIMTNTFATKAAAELKTFRG